jgi:prolyl-tRNA editing enzyme YbaK/EbsC (Cys-tRNA(Pro) deacylase)
MSRVTDHLEQRGIAYGMLTHERTYTSIGEARALGFEADEVAKTILLDLESGHAAVIVPASKRLDMRRVKEAVGDRHARLATEDEIERDLAGFELGSLPPIPSLLGIPAYVDPELLDHQTIVFAAGTQTESVQARTEDLFRDERYGTAHLTREPDGDKEFMGLGT